MAVHIKNMKEFAKALQPTLLNMTDQLADRVYETLNYFLLDYYAGYEPSSYQRKKNVTGYQVVKWADEGKHGGMEVNHKPHVWRDTMDMTVNNGELLRLAVDYLKSKGFSVRA